MPEINESEQDQVHESPVDIVNEVAPGASEAVAPQPSPRRLTFRGFVVRALLLVLLVGVAFGGGYVAKDRQELVALQTLLEERLATQEEVLTLERQLLDVKLAQAEEARQRATVVEVDLTAAFAPLRESVARAATAKFDALAAEVTAELARIGPMDLLDQGEATGQSSNETELSEVGPATDHLGSVGPLFGARPSLSELGSGGGTHPRTELSPPITFPTPTSLDDAVVEETPEEAVEGVKPEPVGAQSAKTPGAKTSTAVVPAT